MAKRLQVILQNAEYRDIERAAHGQGMTVVEWVRRALADASRQELVGNVEKKIKAIRASAKHESATSDIATMLAEIERGYKAGQF